MLAALFCGETDVLVPQFDAHEVWRAVERHKVNLLLIIGDAMARPLIEAYQRGRLRRLVAAGRSPPAARCSPRRSRTPSPRRCRTSFITDAIGSTETGFTGIGLVTAGAEQRGGPTVTPGPDVIVLDEPAGRAAPGEVGRLARGGHVPLGYYKDPVKTAAMLAEVDGKRYAVPGDLARVEADGTVTLLGRGQHLREHRRGEGLPRGGRGRAEVLPGRLRRAGHRRFPTNGSGSGSRPWCSRAKACRADLPAIEAHVRGQIAGYKVPRSIWLVDVIGRTVSGKADYAWAHRHAASHPPASSERPAAGYPVA